MVAALLLGLATGFGAWWLAVGRYHTVPALVGQSQSAATELLRTDGFSVDPAVDQQYSETLATGIVITTDPGAGSHVLGGKFVKLVVSKGQERFLVPSVAGQSYSQAQQAFDAIPIQLVRSDAADDTGKIPTGQAIGTDPAAGAKVKRGQVITVFVSTGPPVITVPDVKNKTKVDANSTLTQAGFTAAFTQDFSDTVPTGMVLSQSPDGGTAVKFSTVHVVVSKGPPLVTLPQIPNGTPIGEAKKLLQDLGLKVKVEKAFGGFLGQVVGMNPSAGTQVAKGSEVTLTSV